MGGYGSGRGPARYRTVEGCNRVDVRWLRRNGYLRPGLLPSLSWSDSETGKKTASISVLTYQDKVVFSYRYRHSRQGEEWQDVEEPVHIAWTPCNYGGQRPWFVYPGVVNGFPCGRRVAILYLWGL